jgi:hypothetical protein
LPSKSEWLRNFSLLGFLFTSMMAFSSFKFMWVSRIGLEPGFKQHPSGPQVLDLGLGSNKSKQGLKRWTWAKVQTKAIINAHFIRLGNPRGKI